MNRGNYSDGQIMNLANPILGNPIAESVAFQRPAVTTLAPLNTPQVTYVSVPQLDAGVFPRTFSPAVLAGAAAPAHGHHPLIWILPATLAAILVLWISKLLFKR